MTKLSPRLSVTRITRPLGPSSALAAFEGSGTKLEDALSMLTGGGEKVRSILRSALVCLSERDDLETRLAAASQSLRDAMGSGGAAQESPLVRSRAVQYFSKRYTMQQERRIHQRSVAAPAAKSAGDDLDGIFF